MFQDKYKRDNDRISPSAATDERILVAMRQEESRRAAHPVWQRVIAVAACAAIALVGVAVWRVNAPQDVPVQSPAVSAPIVQTPAAVGVRYADVFAQIQSIRSAENAFPYGNGSPESADLGMPSVTFNTELKGTDTRTNTQYADVDEADLIKSHGGYLYVLGQEKSRLSILKANGAATATVSTIDLSSDFVCTQDNADALPYALYVHADRLVVLYTESSYGVMNGGYRSMETVDCIAPVSRVTHAAVYDVSDPTAPRLLTDLGQDGHLVSSRLTGGVLYLVTSYYAHSEAEENDPATFVPSLYRGKERAPVTENNLYMMANPNDCCYTVVTATTITGEPARQAQQAVFGSGSGLVYQNRDHLLLAQTHYDNRSECSDVGNERTRHVETGTEYTALMLFSLTDGGVAHVADGQVSGRLNNAFSVDEYNGVFRLATTCFSYQHTYVEDKHGELYATANSYKSATDNALYTLDSELHEMGRVENLAPDEQVKSVRFDGDIGYVVTYRQTDPLFAIDLSDPADPQVLSALKITGFSEYLHPFANNRLLGFGWDGDEYGNTSGLKLVMFDTADKTDVRALYTLRLSNAYTYSEAAYDHHAILVDADRAIVGVPITDYSRATATYTYRLYTYRDDGGFTSVATLPAGSNNSRGMWVGDVFYLCDNAHVSAYSGGNWDVSLATVTL